MKVVINPPACEVLFDWTMQPALDVAEKSPFGAAADLEGRSNRVQIGVPQVYDLRTVVEDDALNRGEYAALEAFDFLLVRMACSFLPDRRSRYVWARYSVELKGAGDVADAAPLAFDLYPKDVTRESKVKRGFEITPTMKLAFAELAVKAGTESEAIAYTPQVSAAGLLTTTPSWTFESNDRSGLVGARELYLIVKQTKGATCSARFAVAAEVFGRLGPIPLKRAPDHAGDDTFVSLTPARAARQDT